MNTAYPFHPRYLMLYTGYRSLADYLRKSCISIYHPPPTSVNDDSTLIIFFDMSSSHQYNQTITNPQSVFTITATSASY